jgi:hypothetical protein
MKTSKVLLAAITLTILAGVAGVLTSRPASATNPLPVTVTNIPLPIQGTVNAAQIGSWNVGITGMPSVNVANSAAAPVLERNVDAGTLTHVSQKASNLVNLVSTSTIFAGEGYRRVLPDGSGASNFTTPAGKGLVVTDVHWRCHQATPGSIVFFDLEVLEAPNVGSQFIIETEATADSNGDANKDEHFTTGVVVTGALDKPLTTNFQCPSWDVRVLGYLVPNL